MSLPATDGLVLRGTLTYPATTVGGRYPLAVLAHQYPATRDSWAPLATDLQSLGIATLAFDQRGHGESIWGPHGLTVIDTPRGPTFHDVVDAFVSSIGKVGFGHIADDVVRVGSWGGAQNFIDASRLVLFGASVGGRRERPSRGARLAGGDGSLSCGPCGRLGGRACEECRDQAQQGRIWEHAGQV